MVLYWSNKFWTLKGVINILKSEKGQNITEKVVYFPCFDNQSISMGENADSCHFMAP